MKKLKFKPRYNDRELNFQFSEDVFRIISVLKDKEFDVSFDDAKLAWEEYSDDYCAGWLILPEDDDEIYNCVIRYLQEIEDE